MIEQRPDNEFSFKGIHMLPHQPAMKRRLLRLLVFLFLGTISGNLFGQTFENVICIPMVGIRIQELSADAEGSSTGNDEPGERARTAQALEDEEAEEQAGPVPLIKAHAHNDYYQQRPLLDALEHGFCSVEADIFLQDGELRVGHFEFELRAGRTLEALYLDPLLERFRVNEESVYPAPASFMLLVDIKQNGEAVWPVLNESLAKYREMLTYVENGVVVDGPVQVVVSGARPFEMIEAEPVRYAGVDGRLSDLDSEKPAHLIPVISDHWGRNFRWRGRTELKEDEREKLESIVAQAHESGRRVRFWATPENPGLWRGLFDAGVDHINTDNLQELQRFLLEQMAADSG